MQEHIIISKDRSVNVPESIRKIGVQYDHNVNTLTFDCPRYSAGGVDLSKLIFYVNYLLPDNTPGSSRLENITVDTEDSELIHFDWVIRRAVTGQEGFLKCLVCAKKSDSEGTETNHWNTDLFNTMYVTEGLETEAEIEEENKDLITQLLLEMDTTDENLLNLSNRVGELSNLTTDDKSSIVAAVNEVKGETSELKSDLVNIANATCNEVTATETITKNVTWEKGYEVSIDGSKNINPTLACSEQISVQPNDIISIDRGDGAFVDTAYVVTCYKNGIAVEDEGKIKHILPFTVPFGIDSVIISIATVYVTDERTPFYKITHTTKTFSPIVDDSVCTPIKNGLMSAADKQKLDSLSSTPSLDVATTSKMGLMSASDKRKLDNLENASDSKSGLMSASDKQKLDNIISPITVSIEGSGITKNASAYGFLPTNDAETNSIALQNAVNGGGTIIVDLAGVYPICKSLILDSNTTLIFGNGVYLRREADSNGVIARFPFINRGAFTREYNENISIIGLNLLTNGYGSGTDVEEIYGQKGQLAFYCIRHLTIKDLTISDGTAIYYNIHIQNFEDIHLENIHIFSEKDGIHLGKGKDFVIKNVWLKTNDDGIALNAHDYPTGTSELGWIENGLIENVHFMSAPDFNTGRGIYLLGGAWKDWSSGMEVRKYGDAVVSNGRIYRTVSSPISQTKETIVSTVQPSHESGVQTYSDGVTWLMAQDNDICYNAGCRNVHIKDVFCDRLSSGILTFNFDDDIYSRSIYPSCELPMMENITLENLYSSDDVINHIVNTCVPFKNLKLRNLNCQNKATIIFMHSVNTDFVYPESTVMLSDCTFFNNANMTVLLIRDDLKVKAKICNSLVINDSAKFSKYGANVTFISNDLGI